MNIVLSFDIGYGWTKICWARGEQTNQVKFPTAFAQVTDFLLFEKYNRIIFEGTPYIVGESAIPSAWSTSIRDIDTLIHYAPLFVAEGISRVERQVALSGAEMIIAIGLPPGDLRGKRGAIVDRIRDNEAVKDTLRMRNISLTGIEVFPQTVTVIAELMMILHGIVKPNDQCLLVDIGHNTLDIVPAVGGRPVPGEVMSINMGGFSRVLDELQEHLRQEYGLNYNTLHEVFDIVSERKCYVFGQEKDLSDTVDRILKKYTDWLIVKIREKWEERLKKAKVIYLIGGCAHFIAPHFPEVMQKMIFVPIQPEFANARTFLAYVARKYSIPVSYPRVDLIACQADRMM